MLFGIYDTGLANIQEAARISSARNFLVGTITDTGQKLQVSGTAFITATITAGFTTAITLQNPSTNAASAVKIAFDGGGTIWGEVGASYNANSPYLAFFVRTNSEKARLTDSGNLLIGTTTDAGYKLNVNGSVLTQGRIVTLYTTNEVQNVVVGNSNSQGSAQKRVLVRQYSAISSGNKLIIPFNSQTNLNTTTICKVYGHSARYNNRNPLGFEINFSVGSLNLLSDLTSWGGGGNFSAISIGGMNIEIDFTTAYTSGTSDGIFVTIEYMTNEVNYSIDIPNITMN
jgi:hypothetical protein